MYIIILASVSSSLILLLTSRMVEVSVPRVCAADACCVEQRAETLSSPGGPRGQRERQGQSKGLCE